MKKTLRIGTRGSPLALIQADIARSKLSAAHAAYTDKNTIEIVPIHTSGDWRPKDKERIFSEMGGDKGLFTKELEEALLNNHIDLAIHSAKDMPSFLPAKLELVAMLERADPRDALVSSRPCTIDDLPAGSVIGTSSLRRQAQILARRPDLRVTALRGNVDTRLRKLSDGMADATILALAGMKRLGVGDRATSILEPDVMLPSAGQGALGIEIRRDDRELRELLAAVNHEPTWQCVSAERAAIAVLDGSCHTPIAALATLNGNQLNLELLAARPDGTSLIRMKETGPAKDFDTIGRKLGETLKRRLPPDFFDRAV